jgi:hypothetical protein
MNTEKKFFRVKLAGKCSVDTKMINGIKLTKQWQVKVGKIGDFSKFPDVEAQVVVKQGNGFVPAEEASGGAENGSKAPVDDPDTPAQPVGNLAANTGIPAEGSVDAPDFTNMTVEQLKSFLIAKGVAHSELRNTTKSELIERAEFIWSQNN